MPFEGEVAPRKEFKKQPVEGEAASRKESRKQPDKGEAAPRKESKKQGEENVEDLNASMKKLDIAEKKPVEVEEAPKKESKKQPVEGEVASRKEFKKQPDEGEVASIKEPRKKKRLSKKEELLPNVPRELHEGITYYNGIQILDGEDEMVVFIEPYSKETPLKELSIDNWKSEFVTDYKKTIRKYRKISLYEHCEKAGIFQPTVPELVIKEFESEFFPSPQRKMAYWKELYYVYITTLKLVMKNTEAMEKYKRDEEEEGVNSGGSGHIFITAGMFERNINYMLFKLVLACAAMLRKLFKIAKLSIKVTTITPMLVNFMDMEQRTFCNRKGFESLSVEEKECIIIEKQEDFNSAIIQARTSPHEILYIFLKFTYRKKEAQKVKKEDEKGDNDQIKKENKEDEEYEEEENPDSNS